MTIDEAAEKGICRLRRPMWANPNAYFRIDISNGHVAPWSLLYDRQSQEAIGEPTPQSFLNFCDITDDYEEYKGELDPEDSND